MRSPKAIAGLALMGLLVTGCSSDPTPAAGGSQTPQATPTAGGSITASPPVGGTKKSVSVASMTLPATQVWTEVPTTGGSENLDETTFSTADAQGRTVCRAVLGVQSDFQGGTAAYELYLQGLGFETVVGDPKAPQGADGVIARLSGPKDSGSTRRPFDSIVRSWVTTAGTKITLSVTADAQAGACDPESVAASLEWDGRDRPAGKPTSGA